jgi:hypothetical protein
MSISESQIASSSTPRNDGWSYGVILLIFVLGSVGLVGCSPVLPVPENTVVVASTEPNNDFDHAQAVGLSATQAVQINGTLSASDNLDVFFLGELQQGQRIVAEIKGNNLFQNGDIVLGLFDANQDVAIFEENVVTVSQTETVTLIVREAGNYYLGVSESSPTGAVGFPYSMVVTLGSEEIPAPRKQIVYLNYNGVPSVTIGTNSFTNVRSFSELPYGLGTPAVADKITKQVQGDYPQLNIQILSSYDTQEPQDPHSVVFVCANDGAFFGMADQIDWYNQDLSDRAIIFTGLLATSNLTENQFVDATANVVAHELGHLVGLAHTHDHTELMDQSTPMSYLSKTQNFHRASLADFPIGWEDSVQLLQFSLGVLQP